MTNIIKEKAHTRSIILSPAGMGGYSQAKGLGGEHLGHVHIHIMDESEDYFYIFHIHVHTHAC